MIIKINSKELTHLTNTEIVFNYDTVSDTFSFTCPYFGESYFKPLAFPVVEMFNNKFQKLLTGTILNYNTKTDPNGATITVSGYSKTGVLDDCPNVTAAVQTGAENNNANEDSESAFDNIIDSFDKKSNDSTNFSDITLLECAKTLCAEFGISVIYTDNVKDKVNEQYENITVTEKESVASYIGKLATYKNLVLRSDPFGELMFTQVNTLARAETTITENSDFVTEMNLRVNGQNMHSKLFVVSKAGLYTDEKEDAAKTGDSAFVANPLVNAYRPTVLTQGTEITRIKDVAKATLAEELKNISLNIECRGWDFIDDGILFVGNLVNIYAPSCHIKSTQKMLIRSIKLTEDAKGKRATLTCVVPETMTGDSPKNIFG